MSAPQRRKIHGERRCGLLPPQRLFELGVTAVDADAVAGMYAGVKNGNPMMWSQCTWDMKM